MVALGFGRTPGLKSKQAAASRGTPRWCCASLFADLIDVVAGAWPLTAAACQLASAKTERSKQRPYGPNFKCNCWRTEVRRYNVNINGCPLHSVLCAEHSGRYTINFNCGVRLES
ncbi:MAG: hypothetical protein WA197_16995 [Candidatus Acidiferrales bacterium]